MNKVENKICLRLIILFVCFSLIGIIPTNVNAYSNNEEHELGVYSLWEYGLVPGTQINWKSTVQPKFQQQDPYNNFWSIMTTGTSSQYAHDTSKRLLNGQINYNNVFPVWMDSTKDWDDYDLVFFYGHNNMVTPPHHSHQWTLWTNNYGNGKKWKTYEADLTDWGTPNSPMEYYNFDIIDGMQYPGSVTYLYEPFTSALIGGKYHFGSKFFIPLWRGQKKCQNTKDKNTLDLAICAGRLGNKDLDWLILHGCQAVIVCDENGINPHPIGVNAFKDTYGGFHIILGHYLSFGVSQLGDLTPFANNLLSGMPIKGAYFLTEPMSRASAIAPLAIPNLFYKFLISYYETEDDLFDEWKYTFGSYMDDDTWLNPMSLDPVFKKFGYSKTTCKNSVVKWFTDWNKPYDLINDRQIKVEKQILSGKETKFFYFDIYDNEIVEFLGSNKLNVRLKDNTLATGVYPVIMLEKITKNDVEDLMQQNILKFSKLTLKKERIKDFNNFVSARIGDMIYWVEKASGGYSIQNVERMMVDPSTITGPQEAVNIALKHLVDFQLIELGERESLNLLFVSNIRKAAYYEDEDEPCEDYASDYLIGFGRQYKDIPVIGSHLVLRLGKNGELLGVQKNWRNIVGESPSMLTVDDSKFMEHLTKELIDLDIIQTSEDMDKIEIISISSGYFEGFLSNTQEQMGLGCLVNYRHKGDDMILQVGFPIADSDFSLLGEKLEERFDYSNNRSIQETEYSTDNFNNNLLYSLIRYH
jgi:hypothetical protein